MDIDKAYIMGVSFSDNGKYIGWSPLFDVTSYKTLKASEKLLVPSGQSFKLASKEEAQIDAQSEFQAIENAEKALAENDTEENRINKINAYVALLEKLENIRNKKGTNSAYLYAGDVLSAHEILRTLNSHSFYLRTVRNTEEILKNSVLYYISEIIQNLRNMDMAYSPISMDAMQKGAEKETKVMSLMNPLTKYAMQIENMTGKDCIGISAVGEKAFFALSYYWNEGIRSGNEKWENDLKFRKEYTRLSQSISETELQNMTDTSDITVWYVRHSYSGDELVIGTYSDYMSDSLNKTFLDAKRKIVKTTLANANFEGHTELLHNFLDINNEINDAASLLAISKEDFVKLIDSSDSSVLDRVKQLWNYSEIFDRAKYFKDKIRQLYNNDVYADDLISLLLSAATDFHILQTCFD